MEQRKRFLAALQGPRLPGYRAVRKQREVWTVCRTPALSTDVARERAR